MKLMENGPVVTMNNAYGRSRWDAGSEIPAVIRCHALGRNTIVSYLNAYASSVQVATHAVAVMTEHLRRLIAPRQSSRRIGDSFRGAIGGFGAEREIRALRNAKDCRTREAIISISSRRRVRAPSWSRFARELLSVFSAYNSCSGSAKSFALRGLRINARTLHIGSRPARPVPG